MKALSGQIRQLESGLASVTANRRDDETEEPEKLDSEEAFPVCTRRLRSRPKAGRWLHHAQPSYCSYFAIIHVLD